MRLVRKYTKPAFTVLLLAIIVFSYEQRVRSLEDTADLQEKLNQKLIESNNFLFDEYHRLEDSVLKSKNCECDHIY